MCEISSQNGSFLRFQKILLIKFSVKSCSVPSLYAITAISLFGFKDWGLEGAQFTAIFVIPVTWPRKLRFDWPFLLCSSKCLFTSRLVTPSLCRIFPDLLEQMRLDVSMRIQSAAFALPTKLNQASDFNIVRYACELFNFFSLGDVILGGLGKTKGLVLLEQCIQSHFIS